MFLALICSLAILVSPTIVPMIMLHRAKIGLSGPRHDEVSYDRAYPALGLMTDRPTAKAIRFPAHTPEWDAADGTELDVWEE